MNSFKNAALTRTNSFMKNTKSLFEMRNQIKTKKLDEYKD